MPASNSNTPTLNLYQRLIAVKKELGGTIEKGGTAPQQMGGFAFIEWDEIAAKIGMLFAEHGVVVLTSMPECSVEVCGKTSTDKDIFRATVTLALELVNADEPSDKTVLTWVGVGDDTSDKSVQKAATSAMKYLLIKTLMLGGVKGVADSDAETVEGSGAPARPARTAIPPARTPPRNGAPRAELCVQCQAEGLKSRKGYAPKYWPRPDGSLQCDGIDVDGSYANHRPGRSAEPVAAAIAEVFDSEPTPTDADR